jgi:hypothetical protein
MCCLSLLCLKILHGTYAADALLAAAFGHFCTAHFSASLLTCCFALLLTTAALHTSWTRADLSLPAVQQAATVN